MMAIVFRVSNGRGSLMRPPAAMDDMLYGSNDSVNRGKQPLLPAGRKFCKITQNRPLKKVLGRENLTAVRPPFLDKSGRKPAEKNIC
jgi:hypothetical protein